MRKLTIIFLSVVGIFGCSNTKKVSNKVNEVGIKQKTANQNIPYIYKNGYKDFDLKQVLTVTNSDSIYINELRFNAVASSMYSGKLMFDKFGKWDKEILLSKTSKPILIWKNKKLLESQEELFSVYTNGNESLYEIYTSVIILDSNNKDCLEKNSKYKNELINFFSKEISKLNDSNEFYKAYKDL